MITDGPMDGDVFLAYVRKFLAPVLRRGDIVILDNLSSHKVKGVQEAITAAGAVLPYLPPYSPDLNPIERFFSKLKAVLRKMATRSFDSLSAAIGTILTTLQASECLNYFFSCQYVCI